MQAVIQIDHISASHSTTNLYSVGHQFTVAG
jgi:hypothetical protein